MWTTGWRDRVWSQLENPWDLIVIGGGITGAGILREASRAGLRTLLVEANDFASGTSSRSSKLVHGGFRYLKNAQIRLVLESVRERERLLRQARGLVNPLSFLMTTYRSDRLPPWLLEIGLTVYDLMAFKWGHRHYPSTRILEFCPQLAEEGLLGGFRFIDAQTDDARLVLRLIRESCQDGGVALNYARVEGLCRLNSGQVCGVQLKDTAQDPPGREVEINTSAVINATGAWADEIRSQVGGRSRLRHLRGSHLIFPYEKLPLTRAISFSHPQDSRPVFAFPWEGITIIGTTDVDMGAQLQVDPCISPAEADYLMAAVNYVFPCQSLSLADIQSTFSGIRAVLNTGKTDPSKESREFVLWNESGLLTITGGKLTTFRLMAHKALQAVRRQLPGKPTLNANLRLLEEPPVGELSVPELDSSLRLRLLGRYGTETPQLIVAASPGELETISKSPALWAELRWAARSEGVIHLDDLLLRRVRLGLMLPNGGLPWIEKIRSVTQPELGWSDNRWREEVSAYANLWQAAFSLGG